MLNEIKNKKLLRNQTLILQRSIKTSKVFLPPDMSKFVFLCGANKEKDIISERRKAVIEFSKKHLKHTQFFLAEKVFNTLQAEGHKGNILDVEHEISKFSDHIVIILESPSAFAELGAFAHHKELRKKLIIINDKRYETEKSFINFGPIEAIKECMGEQNIIHYKMSADGIKKLDAIGDIYALLFDLLKEPIKSRASAVNLEFCNPVEFNKNSAMFIHDLIYFTGPIKLIELVEVLKIVFGDNPFKLTNNLAILTAFEFIRRNEEGLYKINTGKTYYRYKFDTNNLISTFRNYMLKGYPNRIYAY